MPTIAETYPGVEVIAFNAIVAPGGTPAPIVEKLSADIRAVVDVRRRSAERTKNLGINAYGNTPAELSAWMTRGDRALEGGRQGREHQGRVTSMTEPGAIDCDVHPSVPDIKALLPLSRRRSGATRSVERGINSLESDQLSAEVAAHLAAGMARQERLCGDRRQQSSPPRCSTAGSAGTAILNCLYGVQLVFSEDMAAAFCRALNDWIAKEWLDRDPRLRASIVIPMQNVEYAVDEIERCAKDKRFVQVLVLAMQEVPLGRRHFWPIYAAAERHGLPIGIHAGSNYRNPVTVARLADLVHRGLRRPGAGLSVAGREPDHRGRVRQVSRTQGRADRIGRDLAAGVPVAFRQVLARVFAPRCRGSTARPGRSCATISA